MTTKREAFYTALSDEVRSRRDTITRNPIEELRIPLLEIKKATYERGFYTGAEWGLTFANTLS